MFEKPFMTLQEQLLILLTGETVCPDTDFRDCDVYTIEGFENELHVDTPDGHRYLLTVSRIEDAEE